MPRRTRDDVLGGRYVFNDERQVVQGSFELAGRRLRRNLCTYAQAHLDAHGNALPTMTPAARTKLFRDLWRAKDKTIAEDRQREPPETAPRILAAMDRWIELAEGAKRPRTLAVYRELRTLYVAGVGDHPLWHKSAGGRLRAYPKMQADVFRRYLSTKAAQGRRGDELRVVRERLSANTVRKLMRTLRTFLHKAQEWDLLDVVPRFDLPPAEERRPKVLSAAQLGDLLKRIRNAQLLAAGPERKATVQRRELELQERYVMLAMATGSREGTIWSRRWKDFDFVGNRLRLGPVPELGFVEKNHGEGWQPLPPEASTWFQRVREANPGEVYLMDNGQGRVTLGRYAMTRSLGRWLARMGLGGQGYKPTHMFRAGYISELYAMRVDASTIQRLATHKQLSTTLGYLADPDVHQEEAVRKLSQGYRKVTTTLKIVQRADEKG